jgi:hypothetical protein
MNIVNIHTSSLRSAAYVAATPGQNGTWLNLLAYCCTQENGGKIPAAASWTDRQWMMSVGVSLEAVNEPCGLWRFEDSGCVVEFYPKRQEAKHRAQRDGGKKGNDRRWTAKKTSLHSLHESDSESLPVSVSDSDSDSVGLSGGESVKERKGKERKEKEESDHARAGLGEDETVDEGEPPGCDAGGGIKMDHPETSLPFAEWPTREEWLGAADMQGLNRELALREWNNQERKAPDQRWRNIDRRRLQHHAAFVLDMARQRGEVGVQRKNPCPPSANSGDGAATMAAMAAMSANLNNACDYPASLVEAVKP